MFHSSRRLFFASITCFGLCLVLAGCGSPQSDRTGQGDRPAQGQVKTQSARILANQVGYEPSGTKKAIIQGHAGDSFAAFTVKSYPGGEVVLTGTPAHIGPVAKWKDWDFWTIDWTEVKNEGTYVIECAANAGTAGRGRDRRQSALTPSSCRKTRSSGPRSRTPSTTSRASARQDFGTRPTVG